MNRLLDSALDRNSVGISAVTTPIARFNSGQESKLPAMKVGEYKSVMKSELAIELSVSVKVKGEK